MNALPGQPAHTPEVEIIHMFEKGDTRVYVMYEDGQLTARTYRKSGLSIRKDGAWVDAGPAAWVEVKA